MKSTIRAATKSVRRGVSDLSLLLSNVGSLARGRMDIEVEVVDGELMIEVGEIGDADVAMGVVMAIYGKGKERRKGGLGLNSVVTIIVLLLSFIACTSVCIVLISVVSISCAIIDDDVKRLWTSETLGWTW